MNNITTQIQENHSTFTAFKFSPMIKKKILIVDGDVKTLQPIETLLLNEGFEVTICNDGISALQEANRVQYHLILLDIILPNLDGFELLKKLRINNKTPVMIMSARDDLFDKIYALEIGADDYLTKPFNQRELLARINAIGRRSQIVDNTLFNRSYEINDISLCLSTREAECSGMSLALTGYEFEVLHFLIQNAGQVVSKDRIGEHVHGRTVPYNDRSIDMHISNIRKKIALIAAGQKIKTVRGAGYVFLKEAI